MHYSTGLGGLATLGGASLTVQRMGATPLARFLLEGSGALFGVYLLVMIALSLLGMGMRRGTAPTRVPGATPGHPHAHPAPASRHSR